MDNSDKYKILLADDEPQNVRNLFESLNPEIYRVFVASNGKNAVGQAIKHQPDAIIMDWEMPEMDGMEAIRAIRATDEIRDIPIIVATGKMTLAENLRFALETGANDYIRKPYDPIEIEARVKSMIRLNLEQKKNIRLEKEIARQKLDEATREIEINAQALTISKLLLIGNSKNHESLIGDLQSLFAHVDETGEKMISDIISSLKTDTAAINLKEFETHFEKVHPAFFANLHKHFPELTSSESELCAFIKLNMTNKEILAITHKNDNALKKARQRLKKKLGLTNDDSLYNFLLEFE
jgi:DNA-binding response OmpR family regulator/DNA-binding CsgD family transcriptional regulator